MADASWSSVSAIILPNMACGGAVFDEGVNDLKVDIVGTWSVSDDNGSFPDGAIKSTAATSITVGFSSSLIFPISTSYTLEWEAQYGTLVDGSTLFTVSDYEAAGRATFQLNSSLYIQRGTYGTGLVTFTSPAAVPTGSKKKFAFTRDTSGLCRFFIEGVLSGTNTLNIAHGNARGLITFYLPAGTSYFGGLRVTKGVCRYTAGYTPAAWEKSASISGVIRDDASALTRRAVRAYNRGTGAFVGSAMSDATTGAYTILAPSTAEVVRVAFDDAAGTLYNDIIDRVIPA